MQEQDLLQFKGAIRYGGAATLDQSRQQIYRDDMLTNNLPERGLLLDSNPMVDQPSQTGRT